MDIKLIVKCASDAVGAYGKLTAALERALGKTKDVDVFAERCKDIRDKVRAELGLEGASSTWEKAPASKYSAVRMSLSRIKASRFGAPEDTRTAAKKSKDLIDRILKSVREGLSAKHRAILIAELQAL